MQRSCHCTVGMRSKLLGSLGAALTAAYCSYRHVDAMEPMLLQSYGGGIPTILLSHLLGCVSVFNVRYPRSDLTTAKFIAL